MSTARRLLEGFAEQTAGLPKLPTKADMATLGIYRPTISEMDMLLKYNKDAMVREREEIIKSNTQFILSNQTK